MSGEAKDYDEDVGGSQLLVLEVLVSGLCHVCGAAFGPRLTCECGRDDQ